MAMAQALDDWWEAHRKGGWLAIFIGAFSCLAIYWGLLVLGQFGVLPLAVFILCACALVAAVVLTYRRLSRGGVAQ